MKTQQFLAHHGIAVNPFAEEDAQTDPVFKDHCIGSTYHPTWDKVFGNPAEPSTSIVFGEKGAGKTAMRLQIARHIAEYNDTHPDARVFVIEYDDFNPFLDRFRDKLGSRARRQDRMLSHWKLWDHMDAILALGVTDLIDRILPGGDAPDERVGEDRLRRLDRAQARDLLLLAACYDSSSSGTARGRWNRLRQRLRFSVWQSRWDLVVGAVGTAIGLGLIAWLVTDQRTDWLKWPWLYLVLFVGWIPWALRWLGRGWLARGIVRHVRTGNRSVRPLHRILMSFKAADLESQPLPNKDRTDDRYELLGKFQGLLRALGYSGIMVLVDRVDEPYLINGSTEQMRALLWSMLDNKFLKNPGIGFKLLLPIELAQFIEREDRDFYQRARLDKQNLVPSLDWTGEALFDVANARIKACAEPGKKPSLRELFDPAISDRRLIESLRSLRVPRHMFKFMYRLLVTHCNAHTDQEPVWQIPADRFESVLAVFNRDQDLVDRGLRGG